MRVGFRSSGKDVVPGPVMFHVKHHRGKVHFALKALVDRMEETAIDPGSLTVFISHGDCLEDAQTVADMVKKRFNVQDIYINYVGPVIGAHSGPGTVALFYIGTNR